MYIAYQQWSQTAQVSYKLAEYGNGISNLKLFNTKDEAIDYVRSWLSYETCENTNDEFKTWYADYCKDVDDDEKDDLLTFDEWLKNYFPNGEGWYNTSGKYLGELRDTVYNCGDYQYIVSECEVEDLEMDDPNDWSEADRRLRFGGYTIDINRYGDKA